MKAVLERYDKTKFEVYVFDNFLKDFESATHEGLKAKCENWHEIKSLNDEELIDLIVQNKIDVLFDLAGHTGSGRTNIFNNRIAPVQVTYLGYPNSTGIPNMDFRIGDNFSDLIEYEGQNSERMIRLPCPIWNYEPWPTMQTVDLDLDLDLDLDVEAGDSATRPITFGSANNHAKLQPEWLECWARIMARVTDSRLLLKSRVMDNIDVTNAVTQIFAKHGVSSERLEFCHYSSTKEDHWRKLQEIDIALDSYPFNGATTTCDLLWLGVPVLALAGKSHVSRTSASMLKALGLNDWIADSHEHFIDLAVEKAGDMAALEKVKAGLNSRFRSSTLFDASSFLVHYENAIRSMWQLYCEDSV